MATILEQYTMKQKKNTSIFKNDSATWVQS